MLPAWCLMIIARFQMFVHRWTSGPPLYGAGSIRFARNARDSRFKGTKAITEDQRQIQELKAKIKRMEMEAEILKKATALLMSDPDRFR